MRSRGRKRRLLAGPGFERLLLAGLIAMLAGCAKAEPAATKAGGTTVQLSPAERELVAAWRTDRGLSEGDAISNVMLRRYQDAGHKVRYAGDGLYEVLDRPAAKGVVATFYIQPTR